MTEAYVRERDAFAKAAMAACEERQKPFADTGREYGIDSVERVKERQEAYALGVFAGAKEGADWANARAAEKLAEEIAHHITVKEGAMREMKAAHVRIQEQEDKLKLAEEALEAIAKHDPDKGLVKAMPQTAIKEMYRIAREALAKIRGGE